MRMAKANKTDLECALLIMGQLEDLEQGSMPRTGVSKDGPVYADDDEFFEESDGEACVEALRRILKVYTKREHGGSLSRVIFGMDTVMSNDVFDPALDHLAWHPDFVPVIEERKRRAAAEKEVKEKGGAV